ncbi:hypothetical protein [Actinoallomurus sp. NPDC052274]|uniref:hypothetical protein n=1 Tax=Actinoallomurus sp. NPDC052274 TaxID=3155420 RepID=UPI0034436031
MEQDLTDYEYLGDPDADRTLDFRDHRRQESFVEMAETAKQAAATAPPLEPEQIATLRAVFHASARRPDSELMRWRLRLYCGHVIERTSHISNKTVHQAFTGCARCSECGLYPATIIAAKPLGSPSASAITSTPDAGVPLRRPTRKELEARIAELEAENEALRRHSGE